MFWSFCGFLLWILYFLTIPIFEFTVPGFALNSLARASTLSLSTRSLKDDMATLSLSLALLSPARKVSPKQTKE